MSEIPDDVMRSAVSCFADGDTYGSTEHEMAIRIANAILSDRQRDQWQDISTAPKDGTPVDLWCINHLHYAKQGQRVVNVAWGPVRDWMGNERNDWQHGHGEDFEPTHWQPLPAAPKGG